MTHAQNWCPSMLRLVVFSVDRYLDYLFMNGNIIHRETIIDKHKKAVTIDFSICDENDSHIFYMQPLHQGRKDVEYEDLQGFMKPTLVEILVKFHQYGVYHAYFLHQYSFTSTNTLTVYKILYPIQPNKNDLER